ncbi:hypothetical protein Tco_1335399 [Tanacetum coccineum]
MSSQKTGSFGELAAAQSGSEHGTCTLLVGAKMNYREAIFARFITFITLNPGEMAASIDVKEIRMTMWYDNHAEGLQKGAGDHDDEEEGYDHGMRTT